MKSNQFKPNQIKRNTTHIKSASALNQERIKPNQTKSNKSNQTQNQSQNQNQNQTQIKSK